MLFSTSSGRLPSGKWGPSFSGPALQQWVARGDAASEGDGSPGRRGVIDRRIVSQDMGFLQTEKGQLCCFVQTLPEKSISRDSSKPEVCAGEMVNGNKETRLASASQKHNLSTISKVIHTKRSPRPNPDKNELATRSG
jgi:hypothetical protein